MLSSKFVEIRSTSPLPTILLVNVEGPSFTPSIIMRPPDLVLTSNLADMIFLLLSIMFPRQRTPRKAFHVGDAAACAAPMLQLHRDSSAEPDGRHNCYSS